MPERIQQRRLKGWRMPPNSRSVTRSSKHYGNPFPWEEIGRAAAVEAFRHWIYAPEQAALRERIRRELKGLHLACFCPLGEPCHADVLLTIANDGA